MMILSIDNYRDIEIVGVLCHDCVREARLRARCYLINLTATNSRTSVETHVVKA